MKTRITIWKFFGGICFICSGKRKRDEACKWLSCKFYVIKRWWIPWTKPSVEIMRIKIYSIHWCNRYSGWLRNHVVAFGLVLFCCSFQFLRQYVYTSCTCMYLRVWGFDRSKNRLCAERRMRGRATNRFDSFQQINRINSSIKAMVSNSFVVDDQIQLIPMARWNWSDFYSKSISD